MIRVGDLQAIRSLITEKITYINHGINVQGEVESIIEQRRQYLTLWEERLAWVDEQIEKLKDAPAREERLMKNKLFRFLLKRKINLAKAHPELFIKSPETWENDFQGFLLSLEELFRRRPGT